MNNESEPQWITNDGFLMGAFVSRCRQSPDGFAAAVEAAVQRSKTWLDGNEAHLVVSNFQALNEDEQDVVIEKLKDALDFWCLIVICRADDNFEAHFDGFQLFSNRLLATFTTIHTVGLRLVGDRDGAAVNWRFHADFLHPIGRGTFKWVALQFYSCWEGPAMFLFSLLRHSRRVLLSFLGGQEQREQWQLNNDRFSSLLLPGSGVQLLAIMEFPYVKSAMFLLELAKALGRIECKLDTLHLSGDSMDEVALRDFLSALGKNTSLYELQIGRQGMSWSTRSLARVAAMIAVNRGIGKLRLVGETDSSTGLLPLMSVLGSNETLVKLDLGGFSNLDDECAEWLSQLLQLPGSRCALRRVIFSNTSITHQGALALAAASCLDYVDLSGTLVDSETIVAVTELPTVPPNFALSSDSIDVKAAVAIGGTIGRRSILVAKDLSEAVRMIHTHIPEASRGIVPGCRFLSADDFDQALELLEKHAQLKHIWFIDCKMGDFCGDDDDWELYQTLNRLVPTDLRQKIIDATPLHPTEWCEALGALKNDLLECVYHLFCKWRLEGTSHQLFTAGKRRGHRMADGSRADPQAQVYLFETTSVRESLDV